jgi:hypothetical protein
MALSTITTLENALKTIYKGPLVVQLDQGSGPIMAAIEKTVDTDVAGNAFKFAIQYGRSGGIGARGESDDLPTPSPRKYIQGSATPKNLYARMSFTDKLIRTSKNSKASFADQVTIQMEDLTNDAKDMLRRNLIGTSTGQMGTVSADVTAGKGVVVASGSIKAFYAGQVVDILTDSSGTVTKAVDAKEIVDVDYATKTIYFAANVTVTKDQVITLAGNYGKELTGLGEILTADTSIYGIDRSANKWFNPLVFDKSSSGTAQAFDSLWLQEAIDTIEEFTGGKPNFIACSSATARAYVDEQNTYKRNIERKTVDGGYTLLSYDDVAISKEKYMADEIMYLLTTKNFKLARLCDWDWMDLDGKILARITDKPAYEGSMVCYEELICNKIRANAVIKGIKTA